MISKLVLLAMVVAILTGVHGHCFNHDLVLCEGKITSDETCFDAKHLLLLNGDFSTNLSELLPNLQGVDMAEPLSLPILVCHPIISPQVEKLIYDRALITNVNGMNELRALVGLSAFSLLLQIILLCGGVQLALLIKPVLSYFSYGSS